MNKRSALRDRHLRDETRFNEDWLRSGWIGPDPLHPYTPVTPSAFMRACGGLLDVLLAWPVQFFEWMHQRHQRGRENRMLQKMSDHQLKDIGLSRADVYGGFGKRPR